MTPKERVAMQQALEALRATQISNYHFTNEQAITALREALAEQAEQEPVGYFAYDEEHDIWEELTGPNAPGATPLYTAPVRTKDLTPHEITALIREGAADGGWQGFAQRVIAAYKEKNK